MSGRLVTLGETMVTLTAQRIAPLKHVPSMALSTAGSEATVAIGVRRLGHPATYVTRVGADPMGDLVLDRLLAEGVDVRARRGPGPTGLMLKERPRADLRRVHYYRHGSAASELTPDEVPDDLGPDDLVHVTGITAALGDGPRAAVTAAVTAAWAVGARVSLDVNHRSRLWDAPTARETVLGLLPSVHVLFASLDEAELLLGTRGREPSEMAAALLDLGPTVAVITCGADGAAVAASGTVHPIAPVPATEVDPFGAGDSFVAGFLAAVLENRGPLDAARQAAVVAARAVAADGDWEGLPFRDEIVDSIGGDIRR